MYSFEIELLSVPILYDGIILDKGLVGWSRVSLKLNVSWLDGLGLLSDCLGILGDCLGILGDCLGVLVMVLGL